MFSPHRNDKYVRRYKTMKKCNSICFKCWEIVHDIYSTSNYHTLSFVLFVIYSFFTAVNIGLIKKTIIVEENDN